MSGAATRSLTRPAGVASAGAARIAVIGVGPGGLPEGAAGRLASATLIVGGARHLDAHATGLEAELVRLSGDLKPALAAIEARDGEIVVLASGDPGFFGIVRALTERFGRERLEVMPAPSSVALAFARAGIPWDDALVVSAHGRDPAAAIATALAHPKVAVLTSPDFGPAELARALGEAERLVVVAERLGEAGERVIEGSPAEIGTRSFADPNVVLVLDPARLVGAKGRLWPPRGPDRWALEESEFAHRDGMVTKAEVRALALARLGPGIGDLIWDVGAGSGSVGIECARLGAAAIAIDRDEEACRLARENATAHGVALQVVHGPAPAALANLPDPDAVFVGGAGRELPAILDAAAARARRSVVVALATIERVVPATDRLAAAGLEVETVMLSAARLRGIAGLHRLAGANPIFLVSGRRA